MTQIKEGTKAWALDKRDRSFQYGRLLAAMERVEEDYYYNKKKGNGKEDGQENRQTNAIKYMSEFRRRPFSVYERVNRHLQLAYLGRVEPWQGRPLQAAGGRDHRHPA